MNAETALYVSLGHNSSAVVAHGGEVMRGYEQERIDRKKSSSAYPREAIELCLPGQSVADVAYVSHWHDAFELRSSKYLDLDHLRSKAGRIVSLSPEFTHHDAHAQSALSFLKSNSPFEHEEADILVIDGFGNRQECFSVYRAWPGERPQLRHRTYGYDVSLGLMYQYATEYLGLRPHRDEYKLLGYESRVLDAAPRGHAERALSMIKTQARDHAIRMLTAVQPCADAANGLINAEALGYAKTCWTNWINAWRYCYSPGAPSEHVKSWVAWCAQTFLEECVVELIRLLGLGHGHGRTLIMTGGCAYNVKLNRRVQTVAPGRRVFSHPLAGDQGAAMGHTPGLVAKGLTWGARAIRETQGLPIGCHHVDRGEWVGAASRALEAGRIVNVVRGGMEYGPRALCHTTTFAWPTAQSVRLINSLNERDEAMPMAPVVTRKSALSLFRHDELLGIAPSDRFMITTVAWQQPPSDAMRGVAHPDPLDPNLWTARPQVVDEGSDEAELLRSVDAACLINTSFNYHGEPIVFTEDDARQTHRSQCFRAQELGLPEPVTLLVSNT